MKDLTTYKTNVDMTVETEKITINKIEGQISNCKCHNQQNHQQRNYFFKRCFKNDPFSE